MKTAVQPVVPSNSRTITLFVGSALNDKAMNIFSRATNMRGKLGMNAARDAILSSENRGRARSEKTKYESNSFTTLRCHKYYRIRSVNCRIICNSSIDSSLQHASWDQNGTSRNWVARASASSSVGNANAPERQVASALFLAYCYYPKWNWIICLDPILAHDSD